MKVNEKILSIPPHLSTRWDFVLSLRVSEGLLIVTLKDGTVCPIPDLSKEDLDKIFSFHVESTEHPTQTKIDLTPFLEGLKVGFKEIADMIGKFGSSPLSALGSAVEHDPAHANLPNIPPDMVQKVQLLINVIPKEEILAMPRDHEGCNCMYCQMNRILRQAVEDQQHALPEEVSPQQEGGEPVEEKDLEFTEWIVEPVADKLYRVVNKLDPKEEYRVFLGDPIGCTCGKSRCEHILAVLRS